MSQKISLNYCCGLCFKKCPAKFCSRCKKTWYCGGQHQKEDFPLHKEFCKALETFSQQDHQKLGQQARAITNPRISDHQIRFLEETQVLVDWFERELGRSLHPGENQRILYREVCKTCYKSAWTGTRLTPCPECYQVSFCTNHMKDYANHKMECAEFATFQQGCALKAIGQVERIPMVLQTDNVSLEKFQKIGDYLACLTKQPQPATLLCADNLTWPLTIMLCIEKLSKGTSHSLHIHVIGAEDELDNLAYFEEIVHWFPSLKQLYLYFIGPNLKQPACGTTNKKMCPKCQSAGKMINFSCETQLYHEREVTIEAPADFAIGFHPGLSIYSSFGPTLKLIEKKKLPCFFSSWTRHEADEYVDVLHEELGEELSVEVFENPFRSPFAFLNPKDHHDLYYDNNFLVAFNLPSRSNLN